jgi:5-methylcytosine-specific restriction endonuclease McrA
MQFSEKTWKSIRRLVEAGFTAPEICKRVRGLTPSQIYNRKRKWEKEKYYKDPKNAIFHTPRYKAWRLAVFRRDGFKCRHCGRSGKRVRLEADHIKPRSVFPELTYVVSNGRTLCRSCHVKTPTFGKKALNYRRLKLTN